MIYGLLQKIQNILRQLIHFFNYFNKLYFHKLYSCSKAAAYDTLNAGLNWNHDLLQQIFSDILVEIDSKDCEWIILNDNNKKMIQVIDTSYWLLNAFLVNLYSLLEARLFSTKIKQNISIFTIFTSMNHLICFSFWSVRKMIYIKVKSLSSTFNFWVYLIAKCRVVI